MKQADGGDQRTFEHHRAAQHAAAETERAERSQFAGAQADTGGEGDRQPEQSDQHRCGFERVGHGKALVEDRQAQPANLGSFGHFQSVLPA
jgi:hypothetical protein